MTPALALKVCRILPLLGSDRDGEVLAAVAALRRTLGAARLDLLDLAREIQGQPVAEIPDLARRPSRERTPAAPLDPEALRLLRVGLRLDIMTPWEAEFTASILEAVQRPGWEPSRRQRDVLQRLCERVQEVEQHP